MTACSLLTSADLNLEAHGSRPLTSIVASGTATLTRGRVLGHSMRHSLRYSASSVQGGRSRPTSRASNVSGDSRGSANLDELVVMRPKRGSFSPSSPRLSGTFVDLRSRRVSGVSLAESEDAYSSRSSIVSTSSSSTVTSLNANNNHQFESRLVSDVQRAGRSPVFPSTAEEEDEDERSVAEAATGLPAPASAAAYASADTSTSSQNSSQDQEDEILETPV